MSNSININTHHAYLNTDIVISSTVPNITIEDKLTGRNWVIVDKIIIRLSAGRHILICQELNEEIQVIIEDAVKFGGSSLKKGYVFDDNSWVFVVMKDRTYIANVDTDEEKVEFNITPEEIRSLGMYNGLPNNYFLFRTAQEFSLYNVQLGKITKTFTNHIYSNSYYIVYQDDDKFVVYDYHGNCVLTEFDGQYSFGSKLYFIKNNKLFGLDWSSTKINGIEYVGEVQKNSILYKNTLLKIKGDYIKQKDSFYKAYTFYELGNGEEEMTSTNLLFPYFIANWFGTETDEFLHVKEERDDFIEKSKDFLSSNVSHVCYGLKFDSFIISESNNRKEFVFKGEIIRYPDFYEIKQKFSLKTQAGRAANIKNISFYPNSEEVKDITNSTVEDKHNNPEGERLIAYSASKQRIITMKDSCFYFHDFNNSFHCILFEKIFDTSSYSNAFFTSDGKHVIFQSIDGKFDIMGFEDLSLDKFEIDGSTVSRTSGFNGYKPIIEISENDSRIPIWRDAITLQRIDRDELSDRIFMSPDRNYSASTSMLTVYFNRLTGKEITHKEYQELRTKYDWNEYPNNDEKKKEKEEKRKTRSNLILENPKKIWEERILEKYQGIDDWPTNGHETKEQRKERIINSELNDYTEKNCCFTELFIDILNYVCYKNNSTGGENRILIGRSVWFLNYVSFSYDSKYLAFGAKMKQDSFRQSEEGVFVLFDLDEEGEVIRKSEKDNLYAVWMTMFSKKGDVAFYDSRANAYVAKGSDMYSTINEIEGKSLLCFSPQGNYIALSDQNYIDFTHHPIENWGHRPSGNVFIYGLDDLNKCLEHHNDFGEGIVGSSSRLRRRGNVASAAFSLDEKRLMAVGDDGVIVVRNLHINNYFNDVKKNDNNNLASQTNSNRHQLLREENFWIDNYGAKYRRDWSTLLSGPDTHIVESLVINPERFTSNELWVSNRCTSKSGNTVYWCSFNTFQNGALLYLGQSVWKELEVVNKESVWKRIANGEFIIREARDRETGEWLLNDKKEPIMMITKMNCYIHGNLETGKVTSPFYKELKDTVVYTVKPGTTIIKDYAFSCSKSLQRVFIPDSIERIGHDIFKGCNSLKTIYIPIGTIEKFQRLLPAYKNMLVESKRMPI